MNEKIAKIIRKWAKLRNLDYKHCKMIYGRSSDINKMKQIVDMRAEIEMAENAVIPKK